MASPSRTDRSESRFEREARRKLERADVVSFDIFDTLLQRPTARPTDLFEHLNEDVAELLGWSFVDFKTERRTAERIARQRAKATGLGETSFEAIYDVLTERLRLTEVQRDAIAELEMDLERRVLYPRPVGRRLYEHAKSLGKRIVLVSDMYLPLPFLEELLEKNGFSAHEKLYLSTHVGKQKHTGELFAHVLEELRVAPARMLHVGDNDHGDIAKAREHGIETLHLTRPDVRFATTTAYRRVWESDEPRQNYHWKSVLSTVAKRLADEPDHEDSGSLFGGDPWVLGYYGFGPLLLGFAKWVLETAKKQGYRELFFLSRDGKIVLDAYRILASRYEDAPRAEYLLCSRRAVNVPGLHSVGDVYNRLHSGYAPSKIPDIFEGRIGLRASEIPPELYRKHGVTPDKLVSQDERDVLLSMVPDLLERILANAEEERTNYLAYLESVGFRASREVAVVDIGYAGTMQESLFKLLDEGGPIGGLYLMTFRQALKRIVERGMEARGYLGDFLDRADSFHPFCRHVPLYETFFGSSDTSLVRVDRKADGSLEPVFMPHEPGEEKRIALVDRVHEGALAFVEDFANAWGPELARVDIEPNKSLRTLASFFAAPDAVDARLLQGIPFEDAFSAAGVRYIIPEDARLKHDRAIWEAGRMAILYGKRFSVKDAFSFDWIVPLVTGPGQLVAPLVVHAVDTIGPRVLTPRKVAKLRRDPASFFSDTKGPWLRAVGHVYLKNRKKDEDGL